MMAPELPCGIDGCTHVARYPHLLGQHRKIEHGIDGQSETAARTRARRAQTSANPVSPAKRIMVVAPAVDEASYEWGRWTDDDRRLLRALSAAWGRDMPATVELLRTRTMATVRRDPAVKRLLHAEQVIDTERRKSLRTV